MAEPPGARPATDCLAVVATTHAVQSRYAGRPFWPLTDAETQRAAALVQPAARADYIASHRLVREVAAALGGGVAQGLTVVQRCQRCGGAHGAPRMAERPELFVSLSRRAGVVAAAAARTPVAIDIESWRHADSLDELEARIFSAGEQAWLHTRTRALRSPLGMAPRQCAALRLWVRKECMAKLAQLPLDEPSTHGMQGLVPAADRPSAPLPVCDGVALRFADFAHRLWRLSGAVACAGSAQITFLG